MASIRAWLLSVPGTPCLPFCASDTHFGSSVPLRSLPTAQMPKMAQMGRAGSQRSVKREMSIGTDGSTLGSCCLAEVLGNAARVTASPVSH